MGLLSFLWSSKARHEVRYLKERIILLENRVMTLENEMRILNEK